MKKAYALAAAASVLIGLPGTAPAADGLQLGPVKAYPALEVREEHDDNLFLTSSGEEADWVTTVAPSLRLVLPVRRFRLEAGAGLEVVRYADFDEEDAENWNAGGAIGAVFPGGLDFKLSDRYAKRYLTASQEFGAGEDSTVNDAALKVGYQIRDALRLELEGGYASIRYDESADRERDEGRVQADLFWRFLPRTSVFAEVGHSVYDYRELSAQDGSATHGALGLAWVATARSTGTVKAGVQSKRYDDEDPAAGYENQTTWIVSGNLQHVFTRRTSASLELSRATRESDFPENPFYVQTAAGASLTQRFTPRIYGRAGARYEHDAYPNATSYDNPFDPGDAVESGERTDETLRGSLGLGYDLLDWLNLELAWEGRRRDSNFDTFAYDNNRFSFAVRAAF